MKIKRFNEFENDNISEAIRWHLDNNKPLHENVFRAGTENYFKLFCECRNLWKNGEYNINDELDEWFINSDLGEYGEYDGEMVPLDYPIEESSLTNEAVYQGKEVKLNHPMRSEGPKKYKVYVKNKNGKIIKVNFGDKKGGLTVKINDPVARKAFADRHKCDIKKDKTKPGYWACNLPKYGKMLGITSGNFYW